MSKPNLPLHSKILSFAEILTEGEKSDLPKGWNLSAIISEQCLSYLAWNSETSESLLVDPKDEDFESYEVLKKKLKGCRWIAVIDTHTHADHISIASRMAKDIQAPLIMHEDAPSQRVDIRVCSVTQIPFEAGPLILIPTPGHTGDSLTILWGPFIFGGDTLLYGDTGRDDLPGGNPRAHFESIQLVKARAKPNMILLPGHDHKGGRASSWKTQLQVNASLTQNRDDFVREASAFSAPAPKLLKESLRTNFQ